MFRELVCVFFDDKTLAKSLDGRLFPMEKGKKKTEWQPESTRTKYCKWVVERSGIAF